MSAKLSFGPSWRFPCFFEAVFAAFFGAGVASEEAGFFEFLAEVIVKVNESAGNAVLDGAGLAGLASAVDDYRGLKTID